MRKTLSILIVIFCLSFLMLTGCGHKDQVTVDGAEQVQGAASDLPDEASAETETAESESSEPQTGNMETVPPVDIFFSISDAGKTAVCMEPLLVSDTDGDSIITIQDALVCGHDSLYDGGAKAGFTVEAGDYGPAITKLWGKENGGSYGYYVNNVMAGGLLDPLISGDSLYAFGYADLETWSDTYSFIEGEIQVSEDGVPCYAGTLYAILFDENWNAVDSPLSGASILVNGNTADTISTDENGHFSVPLQESGNYTITAVSSEIILIPPVCHFDFTVG